VFFAKYIETMKYLLFAFILIPVAVIVYNKPVDRKQNQITKENTVSFYDFKMKSIEGNLIDFSTFKGKKVLLVNTASQCGFTYQYAELQELHLKYPDLVILGFPANNFMGQEPGSNETIKAFCEKNYGVTFQMMEKISVKGDDMSPLYKWLSTKELNGWNDESPSWNFCKYLVDEQGKLLKYFSSRVKPMSKEMVELIN
jgi:glutathione peroxidase